MPCALTAPWATSRPRSSSSSPLTGQLPRCSHPEWSKVGEQVGAAPIENLANPSALDHDAAANDRSLADTVDDVRVRQHQSVVRHRADVASRAGAGKHEYAASFDQERPPVRLAHPIRGVATA